MYACLQFVMNIPRCPSPACAPTFQHNPVKRVLAARNSRVVIECRPKAAPKPTFSWSKDTELLSNSTRCMNVSVTNYFSAWGGYPSPHFEGKQFKCRPVQIKKNSSLGAKCIYLFICDLKAEEGHPLANFYLWLPPFFFYFEGEYQKVAL